MTFERFLVALVTFLVTFGFWQFYEGLHNISTLFFLVTFDLSFDFSFGRLEPSSLLYRAFRFEAAWPPHPPSQHHSVYSVKVQSYK